MRQEVTTSPTRGGKCKTDNLGFAAVSLIGKHACSAGGSSSASPAKKPTEPVLPIPDQASEHWGRTRRQEQLRCSTG